MLDTGVRSSECVGLNVGDVDAKVGVVHVRGGRAIRTATRSLAHAPASPSLRYLLSRTQTPNAPLWTGNRGERISTSGLCQLLERLGLAAGVEHCNPHTFRRTFALWSLRAGMSIYHLQRLMGHEDITVLRQYLDLVQEDIKAVHEAANILDKLR